MISFDEIPKRFVPLQDGDNILIGNLSKIVEELVKHTSESASRDRSKFSRALR